VEETCIIINRLYTAFKTISSCLSIWFNTTFFWPTGPSTGIHLPSLNTTLLVITRQRL
jgi:hypothetical protein